MIRKFVGSLVVLALMVCMASISFARGAPPGKKAFTQAVAVETVTPTVANVAPVMTGYGVIQNLTTETRDRSVAQNTFESRYIGAARLSPTVDWRSTNASFRYGFGRSAPMLVMLA